MQQSESAVASLTGVTKKYAAITALHDVSLNVRSGELLAVLGPNGAGKTTSVRLMLGLSKPASGRVKVFGHDPRDASSRGRVGAMLQVAKVPETLKVRSTLTCSAATIQPAFIAVHGGSCRIRGDGKPDVRSALRRAEAAGLVCAGNLWQSRPSFLGRADGWAGHWHTPPHLAANSEADQARPVSGADDALLRRGRRAR